LGCRQTGDANLTPLPQPHRLFALSEESMVKVFFRLLLLIGAMFGLVALVGSLLPRNYEVNAALEINAPLNRVFDSINQLSEWESWSAWSPDVVPGLKVDCIGESGVGNVMSWTEYRGQGKLWITDCKALESIDYKMTFANFPESTGRFEFKGQADGPVTVQWMSRGELPAGPFYGFWASNFARHLGHEYQKSLEKLKAVLEKETAATTTAPSNGGRTKANSDPASAPPEKSNESQDRINAPG
jgi:hypothetical protein